MNASVGDQITGFIVTSYLFGDAARAPGPGDSEARPHTDIAIAPPVTSILAREVSHFHLICVGPAVFLAGAMRGVSGKGVSSISRFPERHSQHCRLVPLGSKALSTSLCR
jgi:hypothetical protein